MNDEQYELMTVAQVAARLRTSESFVYARLGESLRYYRLGDGQGGIRISEVQLQEYLKNREGK